jgi:very-short-patch-repair endonuclease
MQFAYKRRADRLAKRSRGEIIISEILDDLRCLYVPEKIIQNGDGATYLDFFVPAKKLCLDIDGAQHKHPRHVRHDAGRDAWLLRMDGIKTVRFPTEMVYRRQQEVRDKIAGLL